MPVAPGLDPETGDSHYFDRTGFNLAGACGTALPPRFFGYRGSLAATGCCIPRLFAALKLSVTSVSLCASYPRRLATIR